MSTPENSADDTEFMPVPTMNGTPAPTEAEIEAEIDPLAVAIAETPLEEKRSVQPWTADEFRRLFRRPE